MRDSYPTGKLFAAYKHIDTKFIFRIQSSYAKFYRTSLWLVQYFNSLQVWSGNKSQYFPGDEYSVSQEFVPIQRTVLSGCYQASCAPKRQTGRPWLQIKVLETAKLPLVERQSTTKKCLTRPT